MRFWNVVFTEISSSTTIIHDLDRPEIIIDLLDYKKAQADRSLTRKKREAMTRLYVKRYEQGLRRFATLKLSARSYGSIEERLYHVYKQSPHGLNALLGGRIKLRTQAGMSDEFKRAADRATVWLPQMEQIFKEEGIPTDITRLAFVESMFNPKALSKVGASGIWQFMPQTARSYMTVNHWIDERSSPLKATRAAARLLRDNYRRLKSWPLAITAYNHGPASLQKATRQLRTSDFETILTNYDEPNFGFASKNFYAEFLTARNVYDQKFRSNKPFVKPTSKVVRVTRPITLRQMLSLLNFDELRTLNPCLTNAGLRYYTDRPLPREFEIVLPHDRSLASIHLDRRSL